MYCVKSYSLSKLAQLQLLCPCKLQLLQIHLKQDISLFASSLLPDKLHLKELKEDASKHGP